MFGCVVFAASNVLRLLFITVFACWLKTTLACVCSVNTLSTNELGVVLGFGGRPYGYLFPVRGHSVPFTPKALDATYKH